MFRTGTQSNGTGRRYKPSGDYSGLDPRAPVAAVVVLPCVRNEFTEPRVPSFNLALQAHLCHGVPVPNSRELAGPGIDDFNSRCFGVANSSRCRRVCDRKNLAGIRECKGLTPSIFERATRDIGECLVLDENFSKPTTAWVRTQDVLSIRGNEWVHSIAYGNNFLALHIQDTNHSFAPLSYASAKIVPLRSIRAGRI